MQPLSTDTSPAATDAQTSLPLLLAALMLVLFLAALDQTIVSTALPTIVSDLGGLRWLSWVVTAYLLASTVVGPLIGGLLVVLAITGRLISRWGRYRVFPIIGTLLQVIALGLLSRLELDNPMPLMNLYMGLLGAGLGMVMQVLILAVRRACPARCLAAQLPAGVFGGNAWRVPAGRGDHQRGFRIVLAAARSATAQGHAGMNIGRNAFRQRASSYPERHCPAPPRPVCAGWPGAHSPGW